MISCPADVQRKWKMLAQLHTVSPEDEGSPSRSRTPVAQMRRCVRELPPALRHKWELRQNSSNNHETDSTDAEEASEDASDVETSDAGRRSPTKRNLAAELCEAAAPFVRANLALEAFRMGAYDELADAYLSDEERMHLAPFAVC